MIQKNIFIIVLLQTFLERTVRISNLSRGDGKSQKRRRSSLPGLKSAASSKSGLLLEMKRINLKKK